MDAHRWSDEDVRRPKESYPASRFPVLNQFADVLARKVSPTAQAVYLHLWRHASIHPPRQLASSRRPDENYVVMAQSQLAKQMGLPLDSQGRSRIVMHALEELREVGAVAYLRKGHQGSASVFRLLSNVPPEVR